MSKTRYFAGVDVGTSYTKAVIIDEKNKIIGSFIERSSADLQKSIANSYRPTPMYRMSLCLFRCNVANII